MDEANRLGPYVLLEQVGVGRHGPVHRARDTDRAGRVVTVKVLDDPVDDAASASFRDVAGRAAALGHPVLLPAQVVVDGDRVALVRAHVPGGSIADVAGTVTVTPARLLAIGAEVAEALAALHDAGLAHGGLTAGDLLLAPGDRPRLADVGLATLVGEGAGSSRDDVQALARLLRDTAGPDVALPADAVTALDTAAAGLLTAAELHRALATLDVPDPPPDVPGPDLAPELEAAPAAPPPPGSRGLSGRAVVALVLVLAGAAAAVVVAPRSAVAPAGSRPTDASRAGPASEPARDPASPTPAPAATPVWQARRAPPACEGVVPPPDATTEQVVLADVDGRGCGLPVVLADDDGRRVVTLPAEAGPLAGRYAVATAGDPVVFGDWDGDATETPAVVTADGEVFVYDRFGRVTARPAGVTLPPGSAPTVVTNGTRDRVSCGPGPTGAGEPAGRCTGP